MNLKERLEAAKKALAAMKAAVESGEKSAEDLQNAIKAVEDLQEKIKAAEKAETLLEGLKKPEKEPAEKETQKKVYKTVGEKVAAKMEQAKGDIKNQSFHMVMLCKNIFDGEHYSGKLTARGNLTQSLERLTQICGYEKLHAVTATLIERLSLFHLYGKCDLSHIQGLKLMRHTFFKLCSGRNTHFI